MHRLTRDALMDADRYVQAAIIYDARGWWIYRWMVLRYAADAMARAIETERFYGRLSAINQRQDYARAMAAEDSGIRWEDEHPATITDHVAAFQATDQMLENAEDALDSHVARTRLAQLSSGAIKAVSGADLEARLAALERIETRAIKLEAAAQDVVAAWEHGDLAHAVRQLVVALKGDA